MLYGLLLVALFLEYARPGYLFPIIQVLKLNSLVPLSTFLFTVFSTEKPKLGDVFSHYNAKWLMFFLFMILLSVVHADNHKLAWQAFTNQLGFFFMFIMVAKLVTSIEKLKKLILFLIFAHLFLLANNIELITQPESRSYVEGATFLSDGNDFSLSIAILIPLTLFLYQDTKSTTKKYIYLMLILILILCVVGTQSRGATLAVGSSAIYLWWRSNSKVWGVLALLVLVVVVLVYAPPQYFSRMNTIANYENEGSAQGRIMAWKSGVRMALDSPLLGQGAAQFPYKLGTQFRPPEWGDRNLPWLTAHSCYFLLLGELGFPGLIYFIGILVTNLRRHDALFKLTSNTENDGKVKTFNRLFVYSTASMISFAVGGAFLSAAYYPHTYILAGMFCAIQYMWIEYNHDLSSIESKMPTLDSDRKVQV